MRGNKCPWISAINNASIIDARSVKGRRRVARWAQNIGRIVENVQYRRAWANQWARTAAWTGTRTQGNGLGNGKPRKRAISGGNRVITTRLAGPEQPRCLDVEQCRRQLSKHVNVLGIGLGFGCRASQCFHDAVAGSGRARRRTGRRIWAKTSHNMSARRNWRIIICNPGMRAPETNSSRKAKFVIIWQVVARLA